MTSFRKVPLSQVTFGTWIQTYKRGSLSRQGEGDGRRLFAILAADVVGYSRLMEQDEAGTFARLRARRSELIEPESRRTTAASSGSWGIAISEVVIRRSRTVSRANTVRSRSL